MRRRAVLCLGLVALLGLLAGCAPKTYPLAESFDREAVLRAGKQVVALLQAEEFGELVRVDPVGAFTVEALRRAKAERLGDAGAFLGLVGEEAVGERSQSTGADLAAAVIQAQYEHKLVVFTCSFDGEMRLIGLKIK